MMRMNGNTKTLDHANLGQWGAHASRKPAVGGRERRSADSYEDRKIDDATKQAQRESVAEWFCLNHRGNKPMRVLSLPDRFWSFENYLNNRRKATFCGIQRDWKTLELGLPWMPNRDQSCRGGVSHLQIKPPGKKEGVIHYAARGKNVVVYMNAGDFMTTKLHWRSPRANQQFRSSTAAWIDLFGPLEHELLTIMSRLPLYLNRKYRVIPVVFSFLAARDYFQSDDERTAAFVDAMRLANENGSRFYKFAKVERHKSASLPYLSVFGSLERRPEHIETEPSLEAAS